MFNSKTRDISIIVGISILVVMVVVALILFVRTPPQTVLEEVQAFRKEIALEHAKVKSDLELIAIQQDKQREEWAEDKFYFQMKLRELIDTNKLTPPESWERRNK